MISKKKLSSLVLSGLMMMSSYSVALANEAGTSTAPEPKQLTIDEKIALLQQQIDELKAENEKLNKRQDDKEASDKKKEERLKFNAVAQIDFNTSRDKGDVYKDGGSCVKLNLIGTAKLNNSWSVKWITKSSQAFRGSGDRGTSNTSNLYFEGKDTAIKGDHVIIGKFRDMELSLMQVGKSEQAGIWYSLPVAKDTILTLDAGRLRTGYPTTLKTANVSGSKDNPNYRSAILSHNFGPTKVSYAYRQVSQNNTVKGIETEVKFPIVGKLNGTIDYWKTDVDNSVTGNDGWTFRLDYGKFVRKAHNIDPYIRYVHAPQDSLIDSESPRLADYNSFRIGCYYNFTDNQWIESYYERRLAIDGSKNKDSNVFDVVYKVAI